MARNHRIARVVGAVHRSIRTVTVGGLTVLAVALGLGLGLGAPAAPTAASAAVHAQSSSSAGSPSATTAQTTQTTQARETASTNGQGYWLVASDGGIFSYGSAGYFGSTGSIALNKPIVGMAATADGQGYWLVASDGGIFTFGDAKFFGSTGSVALNKPIVGMAASPDGQGYWLVASDGGIFSFGDAKFWGSTGAIALNKPIVGMAASPAGQGYWLVASDGGIFSFGDATYLGSVPASGIHVGNIVAMSSASNGLGYWIAGGNGAVSSFGAADADGSAAGSPLNRPIVGFAAAQPSVPGLESPAPLAVATTSLPNASVGVPYGTALSASGGTPSYTWTLTAGALPAGLSLNANGTIAGTPSAVQSASFTLEVTDRSAPTAMTATATLSMVVAEAPLTVTAKNLPNAVIGTSYSASLSAAGGTAPYSWQLAGGSLPSGLTLSPIGTIAGTPTQQEGSSFTVQVTDSSTPKPATARATLTIAVFPSGSTSCEGIPGVPCDSNNWSGYVELDGPFSEVTGTFSVPTLVPGTMLPDEMSEWAGIDGGNSGSTNLIQAGFNETPEQGAPGGFVIQPWWEILPSSEIYIPSVHVAAGDHVTVEIHQISGTHWSITLTDDTNGESFTTDPMYTGLGTSAEWIVEALTIDDGSKATIEPLARYTPAVNFSDLGFVGSTASLEELVMFQGSMQVSTPSAFTANGFNVAYGNAAPSPPP